MISEVANRITEIDGVLELQKFCSPRSAEITDFSFSLYSVISVVNQTPTHAVVALCHPAAYWTTGNTLRVDGGESIVG